MSGKKLVLTLLFVVFIVEGVCAEHYEISRRELFDKQKYSLQQVFYQDYCIRKQMECNELHMFTLLSSKYLANSSIEGGVDVNAKDKSGRTALHLNTVLTIYLLSVYDGTYEDAKNVICESQREFALMLINKGADVNMKDNNDQAPAHVAAESGCDDLISMFEDKGADMNATDNKGRTPRDIHRNNILNRQDGEALSI